jgi:aspartyl-tRNA(Asn)/glutamyl-tRNA(Gln) amidotransferase subunit A
MTPAEAVARARAAEGLHAFITLLPDAVGGEGALAGVPVAVKDNIAVAGVPTTDGTRAFADRVAVRDATVVARLRAAGAAVIGTTNMHEGALGATTDNPFWGRCVNPLKEGFTPGGSSGGSGAVVAAGIVPLALGTDTMGSVRIPAAYCGVWGMKPTRGLIPVTGLSHLSWTLDTIGPIADGPDMLLRALWVMAGPDGEDVFAVPPPEGWDDDSPPARLVLGVPDWAGLSHCEPVVAEGFAAFLTRVAALGVELRPVSVPHWAPAAMRRAGLLVSEAECAGVIGLVLDARPEGFSETFRAAINYGRRAAGEKVATAYRVLAEAGAGVRAVLRTVDAILMPTAPQRAFAHGGPVPAGQADFTALANAGGVPALAFPLAAPDGGLPLSAQLVGPAFSEGRLVAMARVLASADERGDG